MNLGSPIGKKCRRPLLWKWSLIQRYCKTRIKFSNLITNQTKRKWGRFTNTAAFNADATSTVSFNVIRVVISYAYGVLKRQSRRSWIKLVTRSNALNVERKNLISQNSNLVWWSSLVIQRSLRYSSITGKRPQSHLWLLMNAQCSNSNLLVRGSRFPLRKKVRLKRKRQVQRSKSRLLACLSNNKNNLRRKAIVMKRNQTTSPNKSW